MSQDIKEESVSASLEWDQNQVNEYYQQLYYYQMYQMQQLPFPGPVANYGEGSAELT